MGGGKMSKYEHKAELGSRVHVVVSIECDECGREFSGPGVSDEDTASLLYIKGWRVYYGEVHCPDCAIENNNE